MDNCEELFAEVSGLQIKAGKTLFAFVSLGLLQLLGMLLANQPPPSAHSRNLSQLERATSLKVMPSEGLYPTTSSGVVELWPQSSLWGQQKPTLCQHHTQVSPRPHPMASSLHMVLI